MIGRPTFSLNGDLGHSESDRPYGQTIGVNFGGSTFAGTKGGSGVLQDDPDKDVQYVIEVMVELGQK